MPDYDDPRTPDPDETPADQPTSPADETLIDQPTTPADETLIDQPTPADETLTDPTWPPSDETVSDIPPTEGVDATAQKSGPKPWVWVVSGIVVVALIAGIVWFAITTSRAMRVGAIKNAAESYLTALSTGDAEAALATLADQPANTVLLTDDVLATSNEAAPLTGITIGEPVGEDTVVTVPASYQLGDDPVETTLTLTGDGRSDWKIVDGTADLTVPERRLLTVNGVELTEESAPVFPGTYTAAPTSDKVALSGEASAQVTAPDQESARIEVTHGLSELGAETVLNAVKTRFDECLGAKESRPANCPFGVDTTGVEVAPDSVSFTPTNNPWENFAPTLNPDDLTAGGTIPYAVNAKATVSRDGLSTEATMALNGERGYTVDLGQDPATLTWW